MSERPRDSLVLVLVAGALACAVVAIVGLLRLSDEQQVSDARVDELAAAYEAARQSAPDSDRLPTAEEIIDGLELPPGIPGRDGQDGRDGRNGRDGVDGITPACWFTPTQCVGEPGRDGADGRDGVDGQDGADSTVPGPQGEPGADSTVPGPQGERGEPGPDVCTEQGGTWTETDPPGPENRQLVCTLPEDGAIP